MKVGGGVAAQVCWYCSLIVRRDADGRAAVVRCAKQVFAFSHIFRRPIKEELIHRAK